MEAGSSKRSTSRNHPSSRPTTPLRPNSRISLREGQALGGASGSSQFPLEALEPAFAELSDSMTDLEANFEHLQLMHESLSRFSESFASFLYGLNMNAFCVDFPEAPILDSFKRASEQDDHTGTATRVKTYQPDFDAETSFMTTDSSFMENPPGSLKSARKYANPAPTSGSSTGPDRRGGTAGRGSQTRGTGRGTRASGLARAKPRGAR